MGFGNTLQGPQVDRPIPPRPDEDYYQSGGPDSSYHDNSYSYNQHMGGNMWHNEGMGDSESESMMGGPGFEHDRPQRGHPSNRPIRGHGRSLPVGGSTFGRPGKGILKNSGGKNRT